MQKLTLNFFGIGSIVQNYNKSAYYFHIELKQAEVNKTYDYRTELIMAKLSLHDDFILFHGQLLKALTLKQQ